MIYIRKESETVRNGINIYPLNDTNNFGCVIKVGSRALSLRYSKITKRFLFQQFKQNSDKVNWDKTEIIKIG